MKKKNNNEKISIIRKLNPKNMKTEKIQALFNQFEAVVHELNGVKRLDAIELQVFGKDR